MELKFVHLADYAAPGDKGKMIIVGIFDRLGAGPERPIVMPPFHIVGAFRAHVPEGTEHGLEIRMVNQDGVEIFKGQLPLRFVLTPLRTLEANFTIGVVGLALPDVGEYAFHLFVDNVHKGFIPFSVSPAEPA